MPLPFKLKSAQTQPNLLALWCTGKTVYDENDANVVDDDDAKGRFSVVNINVDVVRRDMVLVLHSKKKLPPTVTVAALPTATTAINCHQATTPTGLGVDGWKACTRKG